MIKRITVKEIIRRFGFGMQYWTEFTRIVNKKAYRVTSVERGKKTFRFIQDV